MDVPVAVTEKVALLPVQTVIFTGWVVIAALLFTVSVAALEFKEVALQLETARRYWLLFIEAVTAVKVKVVVVAPGTFVQVIPPSVLTCH